VGQLLTHYRGAEAIDFSSLLPYVCSSRYSLFESILSRWIPSALSQDPGEANAIRRRLGGCLIKSGNL
jgi:hypothetical protein